jgi:hypothetical protein
MKTLLTLCGLLLVPHFAMGAMITGVIVPTGNKQFEFFPKSQIRMEAGFDYEFHSLHTRATGFDVRIFCRWTNIGNKEVKLLLKDHDYYFGTLDYPWGIAVRITSKNGKTITENATDKDGWWSSSNIQSQMSELMPGDAIVLEPGESVVRRIPLQSVVFGLDLDRPKKPFEGDYSIELQLGGIPAAKPLKLHVSEDTVPPQR